ncbi:hypothetical protein Tco_0190070 [Tanacetum coccineum]
MAWWYGSDGCRGDDDDEMMVTMVEIGWWGVTMVRRLRRWCGGGVTVGRQRRCGWSGEVMERVRESGYGDRIDRKMGSLFVVPTKTTADAKKAIQEIAEYSQKWHNGTSRGRSTETSDGLAAIQAQLNNLGREIKKVNEKIYAAQVGCEQYKGPHYSKDCLLKEEEKTLEEAYYTQFGGPFQGGGYRATAP